MEDFTIFVTVTKFIYSSGNNTIEDKMNHLGSELSFHVLTKKKKKVFNSCSLCWKIGFLFWFYTEYIV